MPFGTAARPSIQCGLLKAGLVRAGYPTDVFYLNLELAAEIGALPYEEISRLRAELLLGEWLFSVAAFVARPDEAEYRDSCPTLGSTCERLGLDFARLAELRNEVLPAWIERWADVVDWASYTAVGFSSTFEQNTPSFALARAIKERHPQVVTLFGGANFDGDMGKEYVRRLPFVDFSVSGEGDLVLPQIVERLAKGESPLGIPGVVGRRDGEVVDAGPAARVQHMDSLPDPDYDDFFSTLFRLGREKVLGPNPPILLVETARGCWWGEKQHCTFCGLNNNGLKFRAKSADEARLQLQRLSARYQIVNFEAVDNIMDYSYLEELCRPLAEKRYDYRLFYEVKANLSRRQLKAMRQAGITIIQPGIESLNSHILALMRKGTTMLRNVRLLKWAHYYRMRANWNILTGFPGETEEDYREQAAVLPLLRHLPPPEGVGRIWLERFSPYFFDRSFPVREVRPLKSYRHIYPEDLDVERIAYFFDYEMGETIPDDHHDRMRGEVDQWKKAWEKPARPELVYQRAPDWIQVVDRRAERPAVHAFHGYEAEIYEVCGETEHGLPSIESHLQGALNGSAPGAGQIQETLDKFCDLGLMLREKNLYLSLALPVNQNW